MCGTTVLDKEFYLESWDHAESHDSDVIGYLTTDVGQIEPAKPAKPAIETDRSHGTTTLFRHGHV